MKKTKKGIAVLLLISVLFGINIVSVFATDSLTESEPKVYTGEGTNTLNLEGNFAADGNDGAIWVKDGAQLTINGTDETRVHGTLGEDNYSMAVWARKEGAKIVINGGYYTNETDGSERGTDLIYASDGAQIEINGGKFEAAKTEWTLNCKDNTTSKITVKGGTFYNFDPSNTSVGEGEIVVPNGYGVVKNGDWYTVVKTIFDEGTNTLNLEGKLTANGNKGAILVQDGAQLTINGTDETEVHGTLGEDNYSMAVWARKEGAKIVINGGYYTNETDGSERGTDLIYASDGAQIEINGGKFGAAKTEWTLNCKDNTTSKITVKGGTFYKFDPSNTSVGKGEIVVPNGYRVVKNGDWYTVHKENTITIEEVEGGTVSTTLTKAIVGETVELTATPNEGYELKSLNVITSAEAEVKLTDGKFVMPDTAVIVIAEFAKILVEPEQPEEPSEPETPVQPKEDLDYIVPGVSETETEEIKQTINSSIKEKNPELAEEISNALQNGEKVTIAVEINKLEKDNVKEEEKQMILQTVKENQTVHQYLDISVAVRTEDKLLGNVPQLTDKIKVLVDVPENLIKEGRKFFILKLHDGIVEQIDGELNGTRLEIEVDQFSTFALAYEDAKAIEDGEEDNSGEVPGGTIEEPKDETEEPKEEVKENSKEENKEDTSKEDTSNVPNTGDNIVLFIILAVIAIAGIVISKKANTKREN